MLLQKNFLFLEFFENKVLNKNLYAKYFVRYSFVEKLKSNKLRTIVDNNYNLNTLNLNLNYFKTNYFKKIKYVRGYSILLNNLLYSKKQIQFNFFLFNSKFNLSNYFGNLLQKLRSLRSLKKVFVLVNPVKGGVCGYFNGLCGFFPFKHFFQLIKSKNKFKLNLSFYRTKFIKEKRSQNLFYLKNYLKYFFDIIKNKKLWKFFYIRIKNKKSEKEFKISFLRFVKLKIFNKITLTKLFFLLKWVLTTKKFVILNQKASSANKFFNLNCLSRKGFILPQIDSFIFYALKFRAKSNYYNKLVKIKIQKKKKKKRFFKSRLKLVFLFFLKKRNKM